MKWFNAVPRQWRAALLAVLAVVLMGAVTLQQQDVISRTRSVVVDPYWVDTSTGSTLPGYQGTVWAAKPFVSSSVARKAYSVDSTTTGTSAIAALPYPSRLQIFFYDSASSSGLTYTCSTVQIWGTGMDGRQIYETISGGISETVVYTTKVYDRVTKFSASGCYAVGGSARSANDRLVIKVSKYIGLRTPIRTTADILSVCKIPSTRTLKKGPICLIPSEINALTMSEYYGWLDIEKSGLWTNTSTYSGTGRGTRAITSGDSFEIKVRANPYSTAFLQ